MDPRYVVEFVVPVGVDPDDIVILVERQILAKYGVLVSAHRRMARLPDVRR